MNKRHANIVVVFAILLIPYLLNAPWVLFDYIVAAVLLSITVFALEVATRKITGQKKKVLISMGILSVALYVWAELAVGVFTTLGS